MLLGGFHFRGEDADGLELVDSPRGACEDFARWFFGENDRLSVFCECGGKSASEVFFGSEGAAAVHCVVGFDLGGVCGEEGGGE